MILNDIENTTTYYEQLFIILYVLH